MNRNAVIVARMTFGDAMRRVEVLMLSLVGFLFVFGMGFVFSNDELTRQLLGITRGYSQETLSPSIMMEGGSVYAEVFALLLAFLVGMDLTKRDISSNLLGILLSRSVSKRQYLWGKYLGAMSVVTLFFIGHVLLLSIFQFAKMGNVSLNIARVALITPIKLSLFFSMLLLFSQGVPGFVAAVIASLLYIAGYFVGEFEAMAATADNIYRIPLLAVYSGLPHLTQVSSGSLFLPDVKWSDIGKWVVTYGMIYNGVALSGALYFFGRREV